VHRIDSTNAVAVFPAASPVGPTVGFFAKAATKAQATVLTSDWANSVQEEIAGVIVAAGLTLNKADNAQMALAINSLIFGGVGFAAAGPINASVGPAAVALPNGLLCVWDAGGGGPQVGPFSAGSVVVAAGGGLVDGTSSILAASDGGSLRGDRCVGLALSGTAGVIDAGATNSGVMASTSGSEIGANAQGSLVLASDGADLGKNSNAFSSVIAGSLNVELDGNRAAIIAAAGTTIDGDDVDNEGGTSAIIAAAGSSTRRTLIGPTVGGSLVAAAANVEISTGENSAIIASGRDTAAVGRPTIITTAYAAMIAASNGGVIAGDAQISAIVACGLSLGSRRPEIQGTAGLAAIVASSGEMRISSGTHAVIAASANDTATPTQITGDQALVLGVRTGGAIVSGSASAIVCSTTSGAGPTLAADNTIAGASGAALTWQLDSSTGRGTFDKMTLTDTSTLSAGGAAALANTPTGTAALRWFRVSDGATDYWIPGFEA